MKVIDNRFLKMQVVMCSMIFSSELYSVGGCNYGDNQEVTINVSTANQQVVVGNKPNFSCYVYPRSLRENLQLENYVWTYDSSKLQFYSQRPGGDEIKLKAIGTGDDVRVSCSINHADYTGDCVGSTEVNIVPPAD